MAVRLIPYMLSWALVIAKPPFHFDPAVIFHVRVWAVCLLLFCNFETVSLVLLCCHQRDYLELYLTAIVGSLGPLSVCYSVHLVLKVLRAGLLYILNLFIACLLLSCTLPLMW
jgi:hypothetical protein